jgi:hypothetical protein
MKVLCPRCNETIDLGYLEKNGAQMASCPGCNTVVAATYKKDADRVHWKFEFETPQVENKVENKAENDGCGCGAAILMLIALSILIALLRCDSQVTDKPPADTPAEEVRN